VDGRHKAGHDEGKCRAGPAEESAVLAQRRKAPCCLNYVSAYGDKPCHDGRVAIIVPWYYSSSEVFLRSDLAAALHDESQCRLKVFNTLVGALGVSTPPPDRAAQLPVARGDEPPAPVAPVTTPTPTPVTLDKALERLRSGNVAFNTPDEARVGKQFIVEAKLSSRLTKEEIQVLIDEPGKREVAALRIADRMLATLAGGSAFEISPSGPKEQWISENETTDWVWEVTPKTVGEQTLLLSFDAVITLDGKEDKRTINTFKRRINVDVGWPQTVGEWLELTKKTGENVSWIWATLLIPIGGAIWAWTKRGGRSKSANGDET
jgi:hypothetical protein